LAKRKGNDQEGGERKGKSTEMGKLERKKPRRPLSRVLSISGREKGKETAAERERRNCQGQRREKGDQLSSSTRDKSSNLSKGGKERLFPRGEKKS